MRYKNFFTGLVVIFFLTFSGEIFSQLTNTGSYVNIPVGTYLNAQCNILNDNFGINTGIIANDGNIITTGNISNNGNFISGNLSTVKLVGALQNLNGLQPYTFNDLIIDGTGNKNLNIGINISNNLLFNANNVLIGSNNLVLLSSATVSTPSNQKFVVTNGTGSLVKKALPTGNDFLFPVGDALTSYKPVILNTAGAVDTFAVRVINGVLPIDQTSVQKTYIIKEGTPLATTASVTLGWNTAEEGTAFQHSNALMWQKYFNLWSVINAPYGATSNTPATNWKYLATGVQFKSLAADSFILKSAAPPVVHGQPQNDTVCQNGAAMFSVSATSTTSMGVLSFQWQINCSGSSWSDITNGGTSPVYTGATDSILHLSNIPFSNNGCLFRCVVSDIAGTTISDAASLFVYSASSNITGNTKICKGDTTILTVQPSGIDYLWSTSDSTQSITVNPTSGQNYSVTVTNANNCTSTATISVQVDTPFSITLTSDYQFAFSPQQIITFTALLEGHNNYDFFLNNNLIQSSASQILSTTALHNGTNVVSVIASDSVCKATDSLVIDVKLVNAFTPFDKDNKNDVFAKGVKLVVFNRWGQVICTTDNEGWDGTYKGQNVSCGTYFYIITINEGKGVPQTLTGTITVVSKNN